jgi:HK97 family phage portal protein
LDLFREIFGNRSVWAGKDVTLQSALQVGTALACGRVISEGIAMQPWKTFQQEGRQIRPAFDHWLYDKLTVSPNPLQSAFEFKEQMGLHLAFCGNAYVWMPTVSRRIDALYLFEPKWVTVKYKWPELPTYQIRTDDGRTFELTSAEVWHVRGPSWCGYYGMEFIKLAREALGLSMAIEEGQARMYSQGVQTSGFVSVDGTLTEEQQKKLKKWLAEEHTGSEKAGTPMVMDRAAKWVAQSMSNIDAQTLEQRRYEVEEVCRFMRVLPIAVGHSDKAATFASAEAMFLNNLVFTHGSWNSRLESSADFRLLTPDERRSGYYTKFNEKALLRMSAKDQAEVLRVYTSGGVLTRNEARAKLDENPIEGLDEPLTPVNTVAGDPPRVNDKPDEPPTNE